MQIMLVDIKEVEVSQFQTPSFWSNYTIFLKRYKYVLHITL